MFLCTARPVGVDLLELPAALCNQISKGLLLDARALIERQRVALPRFTGRAYTDVGAGALRRGAATIHSAGHGRTAFPAIWGTNAISQCARRYLREMVGSTEELPLLRNS